MPKWAQGRDFPTATAAPCQPHRTDLKGRTALNRCHKNMRTTGQGQRTSLAYAKVSKDRIEQIFSNGLSCDLSKSFDRKAEIPTRHILGNTCREGQMCLPDMHFGLTEGGEVPWVRDNCRVIACGFALQKHVGDSLFEFGNARPRQS